VLVAHKLDEVLAVTHRITVLRRGSTVLTASRSDVDAAGLTRAMVGGEEVDRVAVGDASTRAARPRAVAAARGEVVARLRDVGVRGARGTWALDGVSLEVRRGEVVGVAGVEGNGQRELALVLAGVVSPDRGERQGAPGVGFISQDRTREGLVGDMDLTSNVALALHRAPEYRRGSVLRWSALRRRTRALMERFDVRAPGPGTRASSLSGGNQQRLVVARELDVASDLLVAESPSRGLDVAAAAFVHRALTDLARSGEGPGIVLLSTDLDEVLALSDRVLVMSRGRLVAVPGDRVSRETVGAAMLAGGDV
jgi:simple sugar transport system ATP-binding protein